MEEGDLAGAVNGPVDGNALETVSGAFAGHAVVEVSPGGVLGESGGHIVEGLVEGEVVVLVEEDWLGCVAGNGAGVADHLGDLAGVGDAVAVEEDEVR